MTAESATCLANQTLSGAPKRKIDPVPNRVAVQVQLTNYEIRQAEAAQSAPPRPARFLDTCRINPADFFYWGACVAAVCVLLLVAL